METFSGVYLLASEIQQLHALLTQRRDEARSDEEKRAYTILIHERIRRVKERMRILDEIE